MQSAYRTWVFFTAAVVLGLLAFTRGDIAMALGGALACVALGLGWLWYHFRGPGAMVTSMKALWLGLPGAARDGTLIYVHHGSQPLWIRCGRDRDGLLASIHTPIGTSAAAFRIWPVARPIPPALGPRGLPHGGPPVERAIHIEARFAGIFHVETSDERAANRIISEDLAMSIVSVAEGLPKAFGGVAYDGQYLGVFVRGALAADPQQATAAARRIWSQLVTTD